MGRLSYGGNISLDGYMNDANGEFDWGEITPEIHQFWNDRERPNSTYVYGRKLYETMLAWETMPPTSPVMDEYGEIWRGADKIVVSSSLQDVSSARTTLVRTMPDLAALKATQNVTIGGPTLAAQALDLIDDIEVLVYPIVVGGGTPFFPSGFRAKFALANSHVFGNGVVHLHYRKDA